MFLIFMTTTSAYTQQTTEWTKVSSTVWESVTNDSSVRVEARVSGGASIDGSEIMGCTSAATYSDPNVFGNLSLEISASSFATGTISFYFFDAVTGDPVYIVEPILHVDKVGTYSILPILGGGSATGNFTSTNGTWTELESNGPIFQSTPTRFNIDDDALLASIGGECEDGINNGTGGGSLRVDKVTQSIEMEVNVTGGLLSLLGLVPAIDEVEFVLTDLIIADPKIEATKTVVENFSDPVSTGDTLDYTITIENTGNTTLSNITLTDTFTDIDSNNLTLISGPTFVSASEGSTEGSLEAGETATYSASFSLTDPVLQVGGVINQVSVLADSPYGTNDVSDLSDDGIDTDGNTENDPTISYFPTTTDDIASVCEEGTIDIDVLSNDDFEGNGPSSGSIFIVSSPSAGSATVDTNGTPTDPIDDYISYTSASGYTGSDSFIYGIRDGKGYTQHATVTITEQKAPNAGTDGAITVCEGETVTEAQLFAQLGTYDSGGTWSSPTEVAGTYTYTVPATAPCTVDDTAEVVVTVQVAPNAGSNGALTICQGETVSDAQLFAQLGGDPDTTGTWSSPTEVAGTYIYTVPATAPCTVDDTAEVIVTVQAKPNAGSDGTLMICKDEKVTEAQLFAQLGTYDSGGTWSPVPNGPGTYTYTVPATAPCTEDATAQVVVTEQAKPNAGSDGTLMICKDEKVTEAQLFAQLGTYDSGGTWSPVPNGPGTYTYPVPATAPCTEDATAQVVVTEQAKPNAGSDGTLTICKDEKVTEAQLFAQLGAHDAGGTWSPVPNGPGTYTYTVPATAPCTEDATAQVVVTEQAKPNAGSDGTLTICKDEKVTEAQLFAQLSAHDAGGTWSPVPDGAGTYTYTVPATAPCTEDATAQVVVTEQAKPNAGSDGTLTICKDEKVTEAQLFAQLGAHDTGGTWSPVPDGAGTYTYTVPATAPCTEDATAQVVVTEQAKPNAGSDGTLTICKDEKVTEAQLFAQLGAHDAGGTWSPVPDGAGTYTYTVPATAPCTEDATAQVVVTEQAKPIAGSDGTLTICEGETVTAAQLFAQLGAHDAGGTWSPVPDGAGTYTYTVPATAPCTEDATAQVVVTEQAKPNAGSDGTLTICKDEKVTEAQLFAQLGAHDAGGTWSPVPDGAGTYTYTVPATAPCTVDATAQVVVTEQAKPNAGSDGTLTICEGETVTEVQLFALLGTYDSGGTWSFPTEVAGTYTYTVPATAPCTVEDTAEIVVTVQETPDAGSNGALTICKDEKVTEAQLFAQLGGDPDTNGTWSPAPDGPGTYTYTVPATAPCTVDDTSTVTVMEQAKANAGTDGTLTICQGETVTAEQLFAQLGGTPDTGGTWSSALAGAGTYTYTVTATAPCTLDATAQVVVTEQAAPNAGSDGTLTICKGETVTETQLFAQLGVHDSGGTWSPALSGAGIYTYTVPATAPCTADATAQIVVTEQAKPNAGSDGTLTICEGETVTEAQLFAQLGTYDSGGTWSPALSGAGTYTYTVSATSPCTGNDTAQIVVTEQKKPNAGSDGTLTICEGETVTETQLFAQLGAHDSGGTWSPALSGAGTYTYTVPATSPCTEDATTQVVVTEQAKPNAGSGGTLTICMGETVTEAQLSAQLGAHDPGGTWSPAPNGPGTYTYTVPATAPCTEDATAQVVVTEQAKPNAGSDGTLTICVGTTVTAAQLFAQLGGTPDTGGTWSPALSGAGTYTYTVSATAPCTGNDTSQVVVTEQEAPNAGTDGSLAICEGETVTATQLFAQLGGMPDTAGTWSPALAGAGTYTYTVSATAPCTEDATAQVVVTEQAAPNAGSNGTLTICEGETVTAAQLFAQLGGTPDTGGTWSPVLAGAGTYTYTAPATAPCTGNDTAQVVVTEQAAPNAGTDGSLTICEGETVTAAQLFAQLGGTPDTGGTWSPALAGAGTYTYTVDGNACEDATAIVTVTEDIQPNAGTDATLSICPNETVTQAQLLTLLGTDNPLGTWSPNPEGAGAGTYTYTVTGNVCGANSTATVTVTISNLDSDGDTILDCQEMMDGTDPFDDCDSIGGTPLPTSDCDNDDLTEEEEALLGTDPTNPDTDGDGVTDGQEVTDNTDPMDPCDFILESQTLTPTLEWNQTDCDMDNLTNEQEVNRGTDPTNPDTDGDTINDGQEVNDNTDPLDPCDSIGGTPPNGVTCEIYVESDLVKSGDSMDGSFKIINIEKYPNNKVEIYNRWGVKVWETQGYKNGINAFNGYSNGRTVIMKNKELPTEVYFYDIRYEADGKQKLLTGYLHVIR
ncbi:T9SS type B sorting domain-containing protein [Maribacter thermophilus]|uniref:T9SS type B sorting domain-containing protein n=1 Tax=Maribacter thermophilus TaxID=1197874 RepID=UPI0018DE8BA0|nr:gliding motility-associated C-terminal domain-containing protein [Maribacter thermophilus]